VTDLHYLGARYYDSAIKIFITEDSYSGSMADPLTMNRYIYARDNPERYSDPTGRMFVVEANDGEEFGGDYLYKPAVMVTNSESERKRNEYQVTDTPAMTTYQNAAFGGNNPYGGGPMVALFDYQEKAFGLHNPYGMPTIGTPPTGTTLPQSGLLGAVVVTLGVLDLTIFVGVAAAAAWGAAADTGGVSITAAWALTYLAVAGASATASMIIYDATNPNPNPEGALEKGGWGFAASLAGVLVPWLLGRA